MASPRPVAFPGHSRYLIAQRERHQHKRLGVGLTPSFHAAVHGADRSPHSRTARFFSCSRFQMKRNRLQAYLKEVHDREKHATVRNQTFLNEVNKIEAHLQMMASSIENLHQKKRAWKPNPVGASGHCQAAPRCLKNPGPQHFRHTRKCWGEDWGHPEGFRVRSRHFCYMGMGLRGIARKQLEPIRAGHEHKSSPKMHSKPDIPEQQKDEDSESDLTVSVSEDDDDEDDYEDETVVRNVTIVKSGLSKHNNFYTMEDSLTQEWKPTSNVENENGISSHQKGQATPKPYKQHTTEHNGRVLSAAVIAVLPETKAYQMLKQSAVQQTQDSQDEVDKSGIEHGAFWGESDDSSSDIEAALRPQTLSTYNDDFDDFYD
ncbi:KIZ protein, partial [Polypterus senegalus]